MTIDHAHLADRFLLGDVQALGQIMSQTSDLGAMNELGFGVSQALTQRGEIEAAVNFILSFSNCQYDPHGWIARFAHRIYGEGDQSVALKLWRTLIQQGKGDAFTYEVCIFNCLARGMNDEALTLFADARNRFPLTDFSTAVKFNVAAVMQIRDQFEQAFALYTDILLVEPDYDPAVSNMAILARSLGYQPAIDWISWYSGQIAAKAPAPSDEASKSPYLIIRRGDESEQIAAAIRANGFCFIKGGCAPEVAEELRQMGLEEQAVGAPFPIDLDDEAFAKLDRLFLFDPKAVMSLLSASDYVIDRKHSIMRRVSPERTEAATPFHQDSTAFQRALYNIWVPLTPAGGAYPTIQFVAKLINVAEQTKITDGEYNRVEIDADFILAKYGNLLRVIEDAEPGDCVMFYGTTIHRTYGVELTSQARFNIEVRWS
jgi:tetratricopeptide (TPR) repeat protein